MSIEMNGAIKRIFIASRFSNNMEGISRNFRRAVKSS
jgi:hypothetical protein